MTSGDSCSVLGIGQIEQVLLLTPVKDGENPKIRDRYTAVRLEWTDCNTFVSYLYDSKA